MRVRCLPITLVASLWLLAAASAVENPSGDCTAGDNGGRSSYHSPSPTDTYLPDCENPLKRELWRVFVQEDGSAYVIPRPDALGLRYGLCEAEDPELATLAQQYGLCAEMVTDPSLINSMQPAHALKITHALHQRLHFQVEDGSIDPWCPNEDVLDACALLKEADGETHVAASYCEDIANLNGREMAVVPSADAAKALAPALNTVYGVSAPSGEGERSSSPSNDDSQRSDTADGSILDDSMAWHVRLPIMGMVISLVATWLT